MQAYNSFRKGTTRLSQLYDFSMHSYSHVAEHLKNRVSAGELSIQSHFMSNHGFMLSHHVGSTLNHAGYTFPKQLKSIVLIRLVSLFEVFLIDQITESARDASAFFKKDTRLDWPRERLLAYDSLEEIVEHFRAHDARRLSSGGFDEIRKYYLNELGFDICPPGTNLEALREIHSRRHLYVHNDGIVDEEYRKAFAPTSKSGYQIGVTDQYLHNAFDLLRHTANHVSTSSRAAFSMERPIAIEGSHEHLDGKLIYFLKAKFRDTATRQQYFDSSRLLSGSTVYFRDVFVGGNTMRGICTWLFQGDSTQIKAFSIDLHEHTQAGNLKLVEHMRMTPKKSK